MKLGETMAAAVDGCNIWGDVCPRKTRPPRIGEIPRHVAIDEESPGSSTHRLPVISPGGTKSVLDISVDSPRSTDTHVTGEQTFLGKKQVTPEDRFENNSNQKENNKDNQSFIPKRIVSADRRLPRVSTGEKITLNRSHSTSQLPDVLNNSYHSSVISTILSVRDKLSHRIGSLGASFETGNAKTKWRSYFCDSSRSDLKSSIETEEFPDHIDLEARKDSAVCLEESDDFSSVTERLLLDKNSQNTGLSSYIITSKKIPSVCATACYRDDDLDEDDNSINRRSLIAKYNRPRRESSGYCSNLSTFDEDRRNSTCEALQGITTLRERRRSSTKRFTTNTRFCREEEIERMPTTEIYRKVSTAGIEMPNIDEIEDIRGSFEENDLNSQTLKLAAFPDIQTPREKKQCMKKTIFDRYDDSEMDMCRRISGVTVEMPDINEDREPSDIERIMKECLHETEEISARLAQTTLTGGETFENPFAAVNADALLKKTSLTGENSMKIIASDTLKLKKTIQSQDSEREKTRLENSRYQEEIIPSPKNRQKKRLTHQYSSPSSSIPELQCIPEKSCESSYKADNTIILVNDEGAFTEERSDNDDDDEAEEDPRKLLPRSIKVYQLLSTQSEDRGDGEPRLMDRRISLQISRHEDEESPCVTLASPEDKRLLHADSVPLLKIPEVDASASTVRELSPIRKLSSSGEGGITHRLGENVGIRPIYPYCPYSPYGSPQGSPRTRRRPLRESRRVSIDNRQGALQLNQYKLLDNIGQGSFGIVKLAYNEEDETHYAMKILSKKKLMKKAGIFGRMAPGRKGTSSPLAKVYREIALLKKLDHPNVVKLVEVLDDPDEDNLYLVFELVQKGEVLELPTDKPLDEETARINFRDVVMGVEYLHYQRIVHRDIKPSNLLVDNEGRVKVADLGVSAELRASGELLSGCAGTPAFAAPETTTPGAQYSGTLCDVWSMGVTLYSLVTGRLPWDGSGSIIGVQAAVRSEPLRFPDKPVVSDDLRDLISHMLAKDPAMRFTLTEIKSHRWLTNHGKEPLPNEADNCRLPVTVTDEEVARVVTRVPKLDTLILIKTMLKQHSFQNPFLPRRIVKPTSVGDAISSNLKTFISDNCDGAEKRERSMKSEQFHKAGRSNSAPDSYDWQTNGRQVSIDTPLTPVTEATVQEIEIEKR